MKAIEQYILGVPFLFAGFSQVESLEYSLSINGYHFTDLLANN